MRDGAAPETKWQQSYDTTLADVFDVQAAVATQVADKLGVVLSPPAKTQLAARPTQNLAAYDAYLRSMALRDYDPPTLRRALAAAEQAVALDSDFAAAWARVSTVPRVRSTVQRPSRPAPTPTPRAVRPSAQSLSPQRRPRATSRAESTNSSHTTYRRPRAAYETALRLDPSSIRGELCAGGARRQAQDSGRRHSTTPARRWRSTHAQRTRRGHEHSYCSGSAATRRRGPRRSADSRSRRPIWRSSSIAR